MRFKKIPVLQFLKKQFGQHETHTAKDEVSSEIIPSKKNLFAKIASVFKKKADPVACAVGTSLTSQENEEASVAKNTLSLKSYCYTLCSCITAIAAAVVLFAFVLVPERYNLTINDAGRVVSAITTETTVGEFLDANNISIAPEDVLETDRNEQLYDGMEIVIQRAIPLTIVSGDKEIEMKMLNGTVEDALALADIDVTSTDELSHTLDTEITSGMVINHVDVDIKYTTREEVIPYEKVVKEDSSLLKGTTVVSQKGKNGVKKETIETVYRNGELYSETVVETQITDPVTKITKVGTGNTVRATITHYCACSKCNGSHSYTKDGVSYTNTASGKKLYNGMPDKHYVAANFGKLGDKISINGTTYTIVDRLGSGFSGTYRIDIFTPEGHDKCMSLGRQRNVKVKLLNL